MSSTSSPSVSRRSLATGAAWSIPAIVVASSAPAMAASVRRLAPYANFDLQASWNRDWTTGAADGSQAFKLFSTTPPAGNATSSTTPGAGVCVNNTLAGDSIQNVAITFYLPDADLTFTRASSGSADWTPPVPDASRTGYTMDGVSYTPYTTTYSAPVTAVDGTTCLPALAFESGSGATSTGRFGSAYRVTINGHDEQGSAPDRNVLTA